MRQYFALGIGVTALAGVVFLLAFRVHLGQHPELGEFAALACVGTAAAGAYLGLRAWRSREGRTAIVGAMVAICLLGWAYFAEDGGGRSGPGGMPAPPPRERAK